VISRREEETARPLDADVCHDCKGPDCERCRGTGRNIAVRLDAFRTALRHEVDQNAHKGTWMVEDDTHVWELLYHAFKLALAHREGNAAAVLHYAADVGNHAWFMADQHGALTMDPLPLVEGAIEYSEEGINVPPEELARLKELAKQIAADVLGGGDPE
jgi:hypothetical protein